MDRATNPTSHARIALLAALALALVLILAGPGNAQTAPAAEEARSVASFLDSRGMGLHLNYGDTPYVDVQGEVLPRLRELGITHVRTGCHGAGDEECLARIEELGRAGIRSTFIFHGQSMDEVREIATRLVDAGALEAVEGPNEPDLPLMGFSYQGQTFPEGTRAYLRDLYALVKGDPPSGTCR